MGRSGGKSWVGVLGALALVLAALVPSWTLAGAETAGLTVVAASPTGAGAPRSTKVSVTFDRSVAPASVSGSIGGAAIVPTQVTVDATGTVVQLDPGELEYGRTYPVTVMAATPTGATLAAPYSFSFMVAANPSPNKRPTTTIDVPAGAVEAGQTTTITGKASGYVWQREAQPLDLPHIAENGTNVGTANLVHPTALYFPQGMDGYKYWLVYTPYPPREDENPVLLRSNDGIHFTAAGVPSNPLFLRTQPPYDSKNLADPDIIRVGDTWMMFYEMETFTTTAQEVGPWMHGGTYIGLATSKDGLAWTPYGGPYTYDPAHPPAAPPTNGNPVINLDSSYAIEAPSNSQTAEPSVVFKDGVYHLWRSVFPGNYIAYTTATDPKGPWTKQPNAFSTGGGAYGPHNDVVYDAERDLYEMVHIDPANHGLAMRTATTPAGPWTPHPLNPVFNPQAAWEGSALYRSALLQGDNGQWYLYYTANMTGQPRLGVAKEVPGVRRVEVSPDGGSTWQPVTTAADGTWSYAFTPAAAGTATLQVRVTDDFLRGAPVSASVDVTASTATRATIFGDVVPAVTATDDYYPDSHSLEVGVKFRSSAAGRATAIRFYKNARNTGAHQGHLWSSTGALLASVDFAGETASGWQQAALSTPVTIQPNTTYVVSFHTTTGYMDSVDFFTNAGYGSGPLRALRSGEDGKNGVYVYSSGAAFPNQSIEDPNYWADVVVTLTGSAPTATPASVTVAEDASVPVTLSGSDPDGQALTYRVTTGPAHGTLTGTAPNLTYTPARDYAGSDAFSFVANDGTSDSAPAVVNLTVTAVNDAPVASADTYSAVAGTTLSIAAPGVLANDTDVDGGTLNAVVASAPAHGSLTLAANGAVTYVPASGWTGTDTFTYTAGDGSLRSAPATVSITTSAAPPPPPTTGLTIFGDAPPPTSANDAYYPDTKSLEVGVRFRSSVATRVTAIRFYKNPQNTSAHQGHLWSSSGKLLASVDFRNETASGWQTATLTTPVSIAANTTYVVSYHTTKGYMDSVWYFTSSGRTNGTLKALRSGEDGKNGVYVYSSSTKFPNQSVEDANYWVDVVTG